MKTTVLLGTAAVCATLSTAPALAQIEEILVTAAKRSQSLSTLPTSATVFSGESLKELRVLDPKDLAEQTPGLLTKFGPNGLATAGFYLRGVGINDFTGTVDPSVALYVDEVFLPTPDMLNFAVFDVQRVEVLRGPQGTLYGRNSTGGAINFITARPTEEFEGYVRGEYSRFRTGALTGVISGPLSENLLARVAVRGQLSDSDSGYSFNRFTGNTLGKNDQFTIRGQLEWRAQDNLNIRLMYSYGDQKSEQALLQHVGTQDANNIGSICPSVIAGNRDEGACIDFLGYFDPDNDPYDGDANVDPELRLKASDFAATIEWDLPSFTVTSITGYKDFSKDQSQDIDASPNVGADNFTFNDVQSFSQELRFTSNETAPLPWIVGFNYSDTDVEWFQTINLTDLAGIPTSNGADQQTEAWAAFAHLTVPLAEKFELIGGIRYTDEQRDWAGATFVGLFDNLSEALSSGAPRLSQLPVPAGDPNSGGPLDFPTTVNAKNVDFQAVLKYQPDENSLVYIRASEAFRSGGFSSAVIFSQDALEPYDPENLRAYEAGFKIAPFDRTVRIDASAFFYDFEGFQATFVRANEANARLQNAGDVEIYGMEAQIDWAATEQLDFNLGISLLDSKIVNTDVVLPPLDGGPEGTIQGNEIPNAPAYSINGRVRYRVPVGENYRLALQADFNGVDDHFLEPNNRSYLTENGYFIFNARAAFSPTDGPWEVAFWMRNIGGEVYRSAAQDLALALGFSEIVLNQPRTWGFELEYRF